MILVEADGTTLDITFANELREVVTASCILRRVTLKYELYVYVIIDLGGRACMDRFARASVPDRTATAELLHM